MVGPGDAALFVRKTLSGECEQQWGEYSEAIIKDGDWPWEVSRSDERGYCRPTKPMEPRGDPLYCGHGRPTLPKSTIFIAPLTFLREISVSDNHYSSTRGVANALDIHAASGSALHEECSGDQGMKTVREKP